MNRLLAILAVFVVFLSLGCSGERDKGKYKDKDIPKPADKADAGTSGFPCLVRANGNGGSQRLPSPPAALSFFLGMRQK